MMEAAFKRYLNMALVCLLFIGCSLGFLRYMAKENVEKEIQYLYEAAAHSRQSIYIQVDNDWQSMEGIATTLGLMEMTDAKSLQSVLREICLTNNFIRMGIIDGDMTGDIIGEGDGEAWFDEDFSNEAVISRALNGQRAVSNTVNDRFSPQQINIYAVPIYHQGDIIGALSATNSANVFSDIVDVSVVNGQGYIGVIKSNGEFCIWPHRGPAQRQNIADIFQLGRFNEQEQAQLLLALQQGLSGQFSYRDALGKKWQAVYTPVGINDWSVLVSVPRIAMFQSYINVAIGIVLIIVAAASIFMWLIHRMATSDERSQQALEYLAYVDNLTGCRSYAKFVIDGNMQLASDSKGPYAIWQCDIRKFKYYNDIFGYETGDELLRRLTHVLEMYCGPKDLFCRMNADNFVGLMPYESPAQIQSWFQRIIDDLQQANELDYPLEIAVGVYCSGGKETAPSLQDMLSWANIAQKNMKQQNGSGLVFYSDDMRKRAHREIELEGMMRRSLAEGEFKVYLQPKVDIQAGNRIVGAEALARWHSARKGMISPGEFIPLFERNGFIVQLDRYMLEQTCRWIRGYLDGKHNGISRIAVNVSRLGLKQHDFLEHYTMIKNRYQIPDGMLELEFTESIVLSDEEMFQATVEALQHQGFICSLDDFGSGYSSLNVLKDLPINVIKLDILFMKNSIEKKRERIIIAHIIAMAKDLEMKTVSEGVETSEQVEFLRTIGCEVVQGFIFAKPMTLKEFEALLVKTGGRFALNASTDTSVQS